MAFFYKIVNFCFGRDEAASTEANFSVMNLSEEVKSIGRLTYIAADSFLTAEKFRN